MNRYQEEEGIDRLRIRKSMKCSQWLVERKEGVKIDISETLL